MEILGIFYFQSADAYDNLGVVYGRQKIYAKAIEAHKKLFEIYFTKNDKTGDAKREIKYLLQNAMEYEDWEKEGEAGGSGSQGGGGDGSEGKIGIDDNMY